MGRSQWNVQGSRCNSIEQMTENALAICSWCYIKHWDIWTPWLWWGMGKQFPQRWENRPIMGRSQWNWVGYRGISTKQNGGYPLAICSWYCVKVWDHCRPWLGWVMLRCIEKSGPICDNCTRGNYLTRMVAALGEIELNKVHRIQGEGACNIIMRSPGSGGIGWGAGHWDAWINFP